MRQAKFTWFHGDVYRGGFKDGHMDGHGLCRFFSTGNTYEGQWEAGMRHGRGKFVWGKGDWFDGVFVNDQKDGEGVFYCATDDKASSQTYVNGQLQPGMFESGGCSVQ